jgi:hypothetical protein
MRIQSTRRRFCFGLFLALLAVVTTIGDGQSVSAGERKARDHGSSAAFERFCEQLGGRFMVGLGGDTACQLANGTIICDARGNDCWFHPVPAPQDEAVVNDGNVSGGSAGDVVAAGQPSGSSGSGSGDGDIDIGPDTNVAAP